MSLAGGFSASVSLSDPPGSSVLLSAVSWLEGTLLGTVATAAAIVAVAAIGLMMLTGRLAVRPALAAILGCFILFGASGVASGIRSSVGAGSAYPPVTYVETVQPAVPPQPTLPTPQATSSGASDPHAGASVPDE